MYLYKLFIPHSQAGFSLLEYLVALSLTTVMVGLSAPQLIEIKRSYLLKHDANRIEKLIEEAQIVTTERGGTLFLSLEKNTLRLTDDNDNVIRKLSLSTSIVFPLSRISFSPGQVQRPARILLLTSNSRCELVLSLRGRVRKNCS